MLITLSRRTAICQSVSCRSLVLLLLLLLFFWFGNITSSTYIKFPTHNLWWMTYHQSQLLKKDNHDNKFMRLVPTARLGKPLTDINSVVEHRSQESEWYLLWSELKSFGSSSELPVFLISSHRILIVSQSLLLFRVI